MKFYYHNDLKAGKTYLHVVYEVACVAMQTVYNRYNASLLETEDISIYHRDVVPHTLPSMQIAESEYIYMVFNWNI